MSDVSHNCTRCYERQKPYTAEYGEGIALVHKALLSMVGTEVICKLLSLSKLVGNVVKVCVGGGLLITMW